MIDFNIVWSVVFALMLIRIVDTAVDYINYQFTKKKRDKAFARLLEELKEEAVKKPVRRATVKKTVKKAVAKKRK